MTLLEWLYDAPSHRRPRRSRGARSSATLRVRLGGRRHAAPGVGVAGRHRRQRAALHRLRRRRASRPGAAAAVRPGRAPGLLRRRQRLRLVALAQVSAARPTTAPAITPRWATRARARGYLLAGSAGRGCAVGVRRDRRRLTGAVVVPTGATPGSSSAPCSRRTRMARGWVDFWLAWIAVDVVGVPLLGSPATTRPRSMYRRLRRLRGRRLRGRGGGPPAPTAPAEPRLETERRMSAERPPRPRRAGDRGHRRRQGRDRRRRRGPRERGRHHLRGVARPRRS